MANDNGRDTNLQFLLTHDAVARETVEMFDSVESKLFEADELKLDMELDQVRDEVVLGNVYWGNFYRVDDSLGAQVAQQQAAAAKASAPQMG